MLLFIILLSILTIAAQAQGFTGYCANEGTTVASTNPAQYYKCENGRWTLRNCPRDYFFDASTNSCRLNYQTTTYYPPTQQPYICFVGERKQYLFDNTRYYVCIDGRQWRLETCPTGQVFDHQTNRCVWLIVPTTTTTTWRPPTTAEPEYCAPGTYKAHESDCRSYYQCDNGYWVQRQCGGGTGWSQYSLTCDHIGKVCKHHGGNTPKPTTGPIEV